VKNLNHTLTSTILASPLNIIATYRAKDTYESDAGGGKTKLKRVGLGPVGEKGAEYEWDIWAHITEGKDFVVQKSRYHELADIVINKPGKDFGAKLAQIVSSGAPPAPRQTVETDTTEADALARITSAANASDLQALVGDLAALKTVLPKDAVARLSAAYNKRSAEVSK
jgi:hypothetical protein